MPLFPCPECGGQVSDAAAACPHCGYPLTASAPPGAAAAEPAVGPAAVSSLDALGPELAKDVRAALRQAGFDAAKFGSVRVGPVTVGQPTVTTFTSTSTGGPGMTAADVLAAMPQMFAAAGRTAAGPPGAAVVNAFGRGYGYDYKSKWTLLGLPLLAMSQGYDPATGRKRVAKGWVAVGDVAVGGIAVGGAAFGGVCLGGVAVGVVSLGGLAVGLALAVGGAAVGTVAVGGLAVGLWAAGGGAFGLHVLGPSSVP